MVSSYDVWALTDRSDVSLSEYERKRASLSVVSIGEKFGASLEEVKEVLSCLGLVPLEEDS